MDSTEKLRSIQFGKPSSNESSTESPSGSTWEGLVSQTASGGISSLLGGGLSSIAGLGGLISDITSLFGSSKATPPPLTLFSLPDSVQQSASLSSKGVNVDVGGAAASNVTMSRGASGIYTSDGLINNDAQSAGSTSTNNAAIAQAVKSALLTSNTLGDVIAEL
ncbi:MAG TPA: hypothetical protein VFA65_16125 [Bryobacteraceae bacterium]|nr:hypothetical protein [Bryobacteraceae bacterium]